MYTVKHVVSCHFSLSPSYSHSLSIHPSHLICCTICAAVINRTPRVLPFTPLLSLPSWFWIISLTRHGIHNKTVWLTCLSPTMELPCSQTGSDVFVTHYALPLHSKPSQLTQHCFDLSVKACCKHKCHNLTHAFSVACTRYMMTLNDSNKI